MQMSKVPIISGYEGHVTLMDDKKKLCTEYNTRE
jgi:hypothetical protein